MRSFIKYLRCKIKTAYLQNKMRTKQIHIQPKSRFSECDYRRALNVMPLYKKGAIYLFKE